MTPSPIPLTFDTQHGWCSGWYHAPAAPWRDLAIVKKERGRWVIDDFVFHVDDRPFTLSEPFQGCDGPRWIGG